MEHVAEQKKWGESMRRRADGILQGYLRDLEEGVGDMLGRFSSMLPLFQ